MKPVRCPRCGSFKTFIQDALLMMAKCLEKECGQLFRVRD